MSYKISYGPPVLSSKMHSRKPSRRLKSIFAVILLAAALFLSGHFRSDPLFQALFPWCRPEVCQAFSTFSQDMKDGDSFSDAAIAFCLEIVEGASPGA